MIAQYRTQVLTITNRTQDPVVETPRTASIVPARSYNKDNSTTIKPMIQVVPRTRVRRFVRAVILTSLEETWVINWKAGVWVERTIVAIKVAANKKIYILATLIMIIDDNISLAKSSSTRMLGSSL